MRRATPAIPPQMYRHFAVVTVILTAALAMFAEGENGRAAQAVPLGKPAQAASPKQFVPTKPPSVWSDSSGGSDFDANFGSPMENLSGNGGGAIWAGLDLAQGAGYSEEYLASLGAEERELLLKGLQENGMLSPELRESRAAALAAASSRRSGAPDAD